MNICSFCGGPVSSESDQCDARKTWRTLSQKVPEEVDASEALLLATVQKLLHADQHPALKRALNRGYIEPEKVGAGSALLGAWAFWCRHFQHPYVTATDEGIQLRFLENLNFDEVRERLEDLGWSYSTFFSVRRPHDGRAVEHVLQEALKAMRAPFRPWRGFPPKTRYDRLMGDADLIRPI